MTNPIPLPSQANTHGHDPFSRCSATTASSTPPSNSACTHAVRPDDARDVDARARAEAEMHGRAGEHLLLDEQARADFDLAADAERS